MTRETLVEEVEEESRILVVEDYPTNQQVVLWHLQSAGYHVDLAENGQQALEAYKRNPYDLILMDIQMPVMGGYEATKAIRNLERNNKKEDVIFALSMIKEFLCANKPSSQ